MLKHAVFLAINLLLLAGSAFCQDLFTYSRPSQPMQQTLEPAIVSRHTIKLRKDLLHGTLRFSLPDGNREEMQVRSSAEATSEVTGSRFSTRSYFAESAKEAKDSSFLRISVTRALNGHEAIEGLIRSGDGKLYLLRQNADSTQDLLEIDESRQFECDGAAHTSLNFSSGKESKIPAKLNLSAQSSVINLLISYTPDAIIRAGSEAALISQINNMVANANLAHSNSATGITYSIGRLLKLSQPSADQFASDLNSASKIDGKWDELISARESSCADQVVVIVGGTQSTDPYSGVCGMAWLGATSSLPNINKNSMFGVISADQIKCNYLTFAHELAHNLGAQHDLAYSAKNGLFGSSYGQHFFGSSGSQYRTVMAYAPGTRVPFFSNPAIAYEGALTGSSTANNAATLSYMAQTVADFYQDGVNCVNSGPAPVVPTAIPTTPPATGIPSNPSLSPTRVKLSGKTSGRSLNFTVKVSAAGAGVSDAEVSVLYDKNSFGTFDKLYASGVTNFRGIKRFKRTRKKGYYKACHSGICSLQRRF